MSEQIMKYDKPQLDVLRRTIAKDCNADEFAMFVAMCKATGLNPIARQIYCFKSGGRVSVMASIDGFRLIAQRSGQYAGQIGPQWCGDNGEWTDVWTQPGPPFAARVAVLRHDFTEPLWAVARYDAYKGSSPIWVKMPDLMIAKCAEALALRRAFPQELSGVYAQEEMDQAGASAPPGPIDSPLAEADIRDAIDTQGLELDTMTGELVEPPVPRPAQPSSGMTSVSNMAREASVGPSGGGVILTAMDQSPTSDKKYIALDDQGTRYELWNDGPVAQVQAAVDAQQPVVLETTPGKERKDGTRWPDTIRGVKPAAATEVTADELSF